jgi:hypothetical protein
MADEDIPCYVGRKACGCAVFAQVNDPAKRGDKKYQRYIANSIAKCIRDGLTIETQTVGWVRQNFSKCTHD